MTLEELQAKREEILRRVNVAQASFGDRSVQYADAQKALSILDREIEKLEAGSGSAASRTTYARFRKGAY